VIGRSEDLCSMIARSESSSSVTAWQIMKPLLYGCQTRILLLCDSLADQDTSDPRLPDLLLCDRLADQETSALGLPDFLLCDLADQEMIAWSESSCDWHIRTSPALWVHGHWSGYKWCLVYGRFCVVYLPYYAALCSHFYAILACYCCGMMLWIICMSRTSLLTVRKAERRKYLLAIISQDPWICTKYRNCRCTLIKSQPLQANFFLYLGFEKYSKN
jgi:hypothetical protein